MRMNKAVLTCREDCDMPVHLRAEIRVHRFPGRDLEDVPYRWCADGAIGILRDSHDQQARTLGVPEKTINHLGDGEKSDLVAAPDEEKNPFLLRVKGGPDRDTMRSNQEPCPGWYNIDARHYLFWQRLAHPEGSRDRPAEAVPYPARLLPARTAAVRVPVLLRCPDLPWPTRCSRDTAMVAVFRLASSHPTGNLTPC